MVRVGFLLANVEFGSLLFTGEVGSLLRQIFLNINHVLKTVFIEKDFVILLIRYCLTDFITHFLEFRQNKRAWSISDSRYPQANFINDYTTKDSFLGYFTWEVKTDHSKMGSSLAPPRVSKSLESIARIFLSKNFEIYFDCFYQIILLIAVCFFICSYMNYLIDQCKEIVQYYSGVSQKLSFKQLNVRS